MNRLGKFFQGAENALALTLRIFFTLVWLALVLLGGAACWAILGLMEVSILLQVAGAIVGGLICGTVVWLIFRMLLALGVDL